MNIAKFFGFDHHLMLNSHMNQVAGNVPPAVNEKAGWPEVAAVIRRQLPIIRSEVDELSWAFDLHEDHRLRRRLIRDGVGDIIVTTDGLLYLTSLAPATAAEFTSFHGRLVAVDSTIAPLAEGKAGEADILTALNTYLDAIEAKTTDLPPTNAELQDAIVQLGLQAHFTAMALAERYDFDPHADQLEIYRSNMSKFDNNAADALATQIKYFERGIDTEIRVTSVFGVEYHINVVRETVVSHFDDKEYPAGKFLKSIHFSEPVFA